jgi:DNA-binding LacI/PurR family transcriptional regulator
VKAKRCAIGVCIDDMAMVGGLKTLKSVSGLAARRNVDVLFFHLDMRYGLESLPPAWSALGTSVDGIVAYQAWRDEAVFRWFRGKFPSIPLVNATRIYPGCPGTPADSYGGMRKIMLHLIDSHGYRRIGFIPGPEGNWAVEERLRAYREVLTERGIGIDPRLVAPYVGWDGAEAAVSAFMDERGLKPRVDLEAIIGANDTLAIGAISALRDRGLRVPADVAVAGYDDDLRSAFATPPVTTVSYNMGLSAFETLLESLDGKSVPERALALAELVVRRSCGCQYEAVAQAVADGAASAAKPRSLEEFRRSGKKAVVEEMASVLRAGSAGKETLIRWMEILFDGLYREASSAANSGNDDFVSVVESQLDGRDASDIEPASWQGALSALGRAMLPLLSGEARARAERAWQRARALVNEIALRERASLEYKANESVRALRAVEMDLLSAHSVADLAEKLAKRLPGLDVPACFLVLHGEGGESRLAMGYGAGQGRERPGAAFATDRLLPREALPDRRLSLVIEPLSFREKPLGFIAFELGPADGAMYESLRVTISSALQGALLLEQVRSHSERLESVVSQTLSTSEEMRAAIAETARQALLVSGSANASMDVSMAGRSAVSDTVEGMKKVQRDVEDIAKRIGALEDRTRQIGEIIGALEDIVAQSDILAINANIQAARAGNAGSGFSVVAREMRQLTDKSRKATENIGLILGEIKRAAEAASDATREGIAGASRGMELAGRAGQTINELSASIEESARIASQISASTEEQSKSMAHLVAEVQSIKDASSRTQAGFEDAGERADAGASA